MDLFDDFRPGSQEHQTEFNGWSCSLITLGLSTQQSAKSCFSCLPGSQKTITWKEHFLKITFLPSAWGSRGGDTFPCALWGAQPRQQEDEEGQRRPLPGRTGHLHYDDSPAHIFKVLASSIFCDIKDDSKPNDCQGYRIKQKPRGKPVFILIYTIFL